MNRKLLDAFKKARADSAARGLSSQYWPGSARDALRVARASLAKPARGPDFDNLPGGFSVEIKVETDPDSTPHVIEDNDISWMGRYADHPRDYGAPDGWMNREGVSFGSAYDGDRYQATPGTCTQYDLAQYFKDMRERGLARGPAMEEARRMAQRDADELARVLNDRYGRSSFQYAVTLRDADGNELDSNYCGGFDDETYCEEEATSAAAEMWNAYRKAHKTDARNVRANLAGLGARCRAVIGEMRALQNVNAPNACRELRGNIARMVAEHHATARELAALVARDKAWRGTK